MSQFEVGKYYRVKSSHLRSRAGFTLASQVVKCCHIHSPIFGTTGYILTSPTCTGIWFDELEPLVELEYETI